MVKVRILGIASSVRHGNTDILVKEALDGSKKLPEVETEFISLADAKIEGGCKATYVCYVHPEKAAELLCIDYKDDVNEIFRKMLNADGIIIGTPVYWGTISWKLKCLLDRTLPFEPMHVLSNKVGAAAAVALERHGGHELAINTIHRWMLYHDMVVASIGPERPHPGVGSYMGACALQGWPDPVYSREPGEKSAVKQDIIGLQAATLMGMKVAELAKIIKVGLTQLPKKERAWPEPIIAAEFERFVK